MTQTTFNTKHNHLTVKILDRFHKKFIKSLSVDRMKGHAHGHKKH